jgi:8-oxo-dGTP pyrophosphatase MutT (NUDIX family)
MTRPDLTGDLTTDLTGHLTGALIRARLDPDRCGRATRLEAPRTATTKEPEAEPDAEHAAVLLPLYRRDGAWHLVFIRRTEHPGDPHSGQVAFPGGRREPHDPDSIATALREAQEEIGLAPTAVRVLGALPPFSTVSRFLVTPVVGELDWPQPLRPDAREVARIFSIPLAWLATPGRHRVRAYPHPGHPQVRDVVFFDEYDGEHLWGVSARITLDFLHCLGRV